MSRVLAEVSGEWLQEWNRKGAGMHLGRATLDRCREWTAQRLEIVKRQKRRGSQLDQDFKDPGWLNFIGFVGEKAASLLLKAPMLRINDEAYTPDWHGDDVLDYDVKVSGSGNVISRGLVTIRPEQVRNWKGEPIKDPKAKLLGGFVFLDGGRWQEATSATVYLVGVTTVEEIARREFEVDLGSGTTYGMPWQKTRAFRPLLEARLREIAK